MLRIDKREKKLVPFAQAAVGALTERYDLGELIVNSPEEFFGEIGRKLFVIGKDLISSETIPIPIDLLALDRGGEAVVVVLQRGKEHSPLARAITCAGMISNWRPQDFLSLLSAERSAELKAFLDVDIAEINREQRAVLVSESYDFEELAATKWLRERYQVDNRCVRVAMSIDPQADAEYLSAHDLSESSLEEVFEADGAREECEPQANRRKKLRTDKSHSENLRLEYGGKIIAAKLVDASDGGLGTEIDVALQAGASVHFAGEIHSPHFCMSLHGRARVAHCRSREQGVYRAGLAFEDVKVKKLENCTHEEADFGAPGSQRPSLADGSNNAGW